jgi:UDP-glucose 4-epimerase
MRTLVTGGCGFIGANLVPLLLERGTAVRVLDTFAAGGPERLPAGDVEVLEGDVRDADAVARAAAGADAVIHLAAAGNVADSVADPLANFEVNARGTLNVLQAAEQAGVARFVFASTGGALIGDADPPVDESSVPRPISPYGASKLAGEGYCHAFRGSYGLGTIALRFANVYGPRSEHKKGAVTVFIKRALGGEPLTIYGDGAATRDFIHVDDLCAGILAALERREVSGVVHLASERETSIAELARIVRDAAGADVPVEHLPPRRGEVERNFAIARHAAEVLGFRPAVDLEEGIARSVDWFRATRAAWDQGPAAHR